MPMSRYIVGRGGEVLLSLLPLARTPGELAEAEVVAVGHEGAHAARFGERQRCLIVGPGLLRIQSIALVLDRPKQLMGMGDEPNLAREFLHYTVSQFLRILGLTKT
jgi:hypothetical protein